MVENNHLSIDLDWIKTKEQLDFINELVFEVVQVNKINFCTQHHALFEFYKNMQSIRLYNIDHHHDIIYKKEWKGMNEGNWVYPLLMKEAVKEYHWIKNLNSMVPDFSPENLITKEFVYRIYDEYSWIKNINFQSLSICLSPEFSEINYQSLWEAYKHYFKTKKAHIQILKTNVELFGMSIKME